MLIGLGIGAFQSAGIGVACALAQPSDISNVVSVMTVGTSHCRAQRSLDMHNWLMQYSNVGQVLGIILSLAVSGSIFTNRAIEKITIALPGIPAEEITQLITGASGHFYKSLSADDRAVVVTQITSAISEAFYYLVCITALGFITSLLLSVSTSLSYARPSAMA